MSFPRTTLRPAVAITAAIFGASALLAPFHDARADEVSPKGKGIAGGALLGAEVVTIVEAVASVRPGWAYGVGALAGGIGGGVAGFFVEKGNTDGRVPTYMLAGGLGLIIPALVAMLNATRYMPEEGATEDRAPTAPAAEPGAPVGGPAVPTPDVVPPMPPSSPAAPAAPSSPAPAPAPQSRQTPAQRSHGAAVAIEPSLFYLREGGLRLGVPVPDVLAVFSVAEELQYGMRSETEIRLPVLHVTF